MRLAACAPAIGLFCRGVLLAIAIGSLPLSAQDGAMDAISRALPIAKEAIVKAGLGFSSEIVEWETLNQFTKETGRVKLPKMLVGGIWTGKIEDFDLPSLVVDELPPQTGVPLATLFQRINEEGDMIRVATTVRKKNGKRAIGTYIPAEDPDGIKNVVVSTVLGGKDYIGRAIVVDKWCITGYSPLKNPSGKVIGMIFVGIPCY